MGPKDGNAKSGGRLKIVLIYLVFGPPIGGLLVDLYFLVAALMTYVFDLRPNGSFEVSLQSLATYTGLSIIVAFYGYIFGGVQAFLTGLFIAASSKPDGKFGYISAIVAPAIVGVIATMVLATMNQTPLRASAMLGAIGVAASVITRFLFRRRFEIAKSQLSHATQCDY